MQASFQGRQQATLNFARHTPRRVELLLQVAGAIVRSLELTEADYVNDTAGAVQQDLWLCTAVAEGAGSGCCYRLWTGRRRPSADL